MVNDSDWRRRFTRYKDTCTTPGCIRNAQVGELCGECTAIMEKRDNTNQVNTQKLCVPWDFILSAEWIRRKL